MVVSPGVIAALEQIGATDVLKSVASSAGKAVLTRIAGTDNSDELIRFIAENKERVLALNNELRAKELDVQAELNRQDTELINRAWDDTTKANQSDDRWVRRMRPTIARAAYAVVCVIVGLIFYVFYKEIQFESHWTKICMATDSANSCLNTIFDNRTSYPKQLAEFMGVLGVITFFGLALSPIAFYFRQRHVEKLSNKDDTDTEEFDVIGKVKELKERLAPKATLPDQRPAGATKTRGPDV